MKLTRCCLRSHMLISPIVIGIDFQINEPFPSEMYVITAAKEVEDGSNIAWLLTAPLKLYMEDETYQLFHPSILLHSRPHCWNKPDERPITGGVHPALTHALASRGNLVSV